MSNVRRVLAYWTANGKPALQVFMGDKFIVSTRCHGVDGKGSANVESGVCCRVCYAEVDPIHGDFFPMTDLPGTLERWAGEVRPA